MAQNITSLPYSDQQASICEKADRMHSSLLPAPYFVFQVFPILPIATSLHYKNKQIMGGEGK